MKDYYQILGVARNATEDDIKKSYRRLAKQYHPDVNKGNADSENRFKEISEAYNVLSNKESRAQYDMFSKGGHRNPYGRSEGPTYHRTWNASDGGYNNEGFGDMGDFFSELFNMGGVKRNARRESRQDEDVHQPLHGQDTVADVEVSFEEAVDGTERKISVKRGDHVEKLTVKIPAGVDNGSKVRVAGKGQPGFGGGKSGDLYLRIRVTPHPKFWREGADIYCEVPITVYDAILGGEVRVTTLKGEVKMKIPSGTESGQKFRIAGKGASELGNSEKKRGDQYVIVKIVVPQKPSSAFKKAFKDFSETYPYKPGD